MLGNFQLYKYISIYISTWLHDMAKLYAQNIIINRNCPQKKKKTLK